MFEISVLTSLLRHFCYKADLKHPLWDETDNNNVVPSLTGEIADIVRIRNLRNEVCMTCKHLMSCIHCAGTICQCQGHNMTLYQNRVRSKTLLFEVGFYNYFWQTTSLCPIPIRGALPGTDWLLYIEVTIEVEQNMLYNKMFIYVCIVCETGWLFWKYVVWI